MDVSTNAILFYGICVSKDSELASKISESEVYHSSPVKIETHGSGNYPMYYICVSESTHTAYRGYPEKISGFDVKPEWDNNIQKFVDRLYEATGLSPEHQDIGWYLVSYTD